MNLNYNLPNDDEIKRFYTLFCEIFTAFHNYAIGKRLFNSEVYSWSLISYYYSLMHCGRIVCFMPLNCFARSHADLHKFLRGDRINNSKFWKLEHPKGVNESHNFEEIIRGLPNQDNLIESKIKELGEHLRKIQKVREFNSYEMFIVAHQIGHRELSPKLKDGAMRISNIVKDSNFYNRFIVLLCSTKTRLFQSIFIGQKSKIQMGIWLSYSIIKATKIS